MGAPAVDGVATVIDWLASAAAAMAHAASLAGSFAIETRIQSMSHWDGFCTACDCRTTFSVATGATFDGRTNLREGLRCPRCLLTARQRLALLALVQTVDGDDAARGAILERFSRLYRAVARRYRHTSGSEYLSRSHPPGRLALWHSTSRPWLWRPVRHQSMLELSYDDDTLAFLVHSDVLEHVEDTATALRECHRVLRPGAAMVFTVPVRAAQLSSVRRGYHDGDGRLVELMPAEYHGDGLDQRGVYTFHNFGWSLFDTLAGLFDRVETGIAQQPGHGFVHADAVAGDWNMPQVVFRAFKQRR